MSEENKDLNGATAEIAAAVMAPESAADLPTMADRMMDDIVNQVVQIVLTRTGGRTLISKAIVAEAADRLKNLHDNIMAQSLAKAQAAQQKIILPGRG